MEAKPPTDPADEQPEVPGQEDPRVYVDKWRKESAEYALRTGDPMVALMANGLELMDVMMQGNADPVYVERAIASLAQERELSLQYDGKRNELTRKLVYDLTDSLRIAFREFSIKSNQSTIGNYSTHEKSNADLSLRDSVHQSGALAGEGQVDSEQPKDESLKEPKEEEPWLKKLFADGDELREDEDEQWNGEENGEEDETDNSFRPMDANALASDGESSMPELGKEEVVDRNADASIDNQPADLTPIVDEATEGSMHTYPPISLVAPTSDLKSARMAPRARRNGSILYASSPMLQCILCDEYATCSVDGYKQHLYHKHNTSPTLAGISFRCACGHVSRGDSHVHDTNNCSNISMSIMYDDGREVKGEEVEREKKDSDKKMEKNGGKEVADDPALSDKEEGEEESKGEGKKPDVKQPGHSEISARGSSNSSTILKCFHCMDYATRSVSAYIEHLAVKHDVTPSQAGIWFRCVCGSMSRGDQHTRPKNTCGNLSMSIVYDDGREVKGGEVEREKKDSDKNKEGKQVADGPAEEGGEESKGEGKKSGFKQGSSKSSTILKCFHCMEYETYNVGTYCSHLKKAHNMTPKQAGIWFHCGCGKVSRSSWYFSYRECGHSSVKVVCDWQMRKEEEGRGEEREEEEEMRNEEKPDELARGEGESEAERLKCVYCEERPISLWGYLNHLRRSHDTTLVQSGLVLQCSCGLRVTHKNALTKDHTEECGGRRFIVIEAREATEFSINR